MEYGALFPTHFSLMSHSHLPFVIYFFLKFLAEDTGQKAMETAVLSVLKAEQP